MSLGSDTPGGSPEGIGGDESGIGRDSNRDGGGGSGPRDDIGFDLTDARQAQEWGGSRSNPDIGFSARDMFENPFGPLAYGISQFGKHLATPNPDGTYGYTPEGGYSRSDGGDRSEGLRGRSFEDWMARGGFAGPALGTPGNDFYDQARFGGGGSMGGAGADTVLTTMPVRGENVMSLLDRAAGKTGGFRGGFGPGGAAPVEPTAPAAREPFDYRGGVIPGESPESPQLYGYGSPYFGPQDIFGV